MKILAIDPGNVQSAYCLMDDQYNFIEFAKKENRDVMKRMLELLPEIDGVVIERMQSYGMPVGETTFVSAEWIGRFSQEAEKKVFVEYVYRRDEKLYICGSPRAKDANIRAALIERFAVKDKVNGKGTKKDPDVFYGVKADMWSAICIGTTFFDMKKDCLTTKQE